jgi:hypothetical protein
MPISEKLDRLRKLWLAAMVLPSRALAEITHEDHDASRENKNPIAAPPKKHLPFLVRSTAVSLQSLLWGRNANSDGGAMSECQLNALPRQRARAPLPLQSHEDKRRAAREREDRYDREIFQHPNRWRGVGPSPVGPSQGRGLQLEQQDAVPVVSWCDRSGTGIPT